MKWAASRSGWRRPRRSCARLRVTVECVDTAKQRLGAGAFETADLVAFHLPMHTATRLAGPIILRVRRENPRARMCAFGLYAPLNAEWLRSLGVEAVFGGEFEEELTRSWALQAVSARAFRPAIATRPESAAPHIRSSHSLPRPRSHRHAAAVSLRIAPVPRRLASHRRLHGSEPRVQASVPSLSDRPRVQRSVSNRAARRGARRHRRTSPIGCPAHHVRRPRLLQRSHARDAHRGRAARRAPAGQLRRDDQGRAPAEAPPTCCRVSPRRGARS